MLNTRIPRVWGWQGQLVLPVLKSLPRPLVRQMPEEEDA